MTTKQKVWKGYAKLYRELMDTKVFHIPNLWHIYTWAVLRANFRKSKLNDLEIEKGQVLISQKKIPLEMEFLEDSFFTLLHKLNDYDFIKLESINESSYLITINENILDNEYPTNNSSFSSYNKNSYNKEKNKNSNNENSCDDKVNETIINNLGNELTPNHNYYNKKIDSKKGREKYGDDFWDKYISAIKKIMAFENLMEAKPLSPSQFKELLNEFPLKKIKDEIKELDDFIGLNDKDSLFEQLLLVLKDEDVN